MICANELQQHDTQFEYSAFFFPIPDHIRPFDQYCEKRHTHTPKISSMEMTSVVHFYQRTNQFNCLQVTKYLDSPHSNQIHKMKSSIGLCLPFIFWIQYVDASLDLCHIKRISINKSNISNGFYLCILLIKKTLIFKLISLNSISLFL